MLIYFFSNQVDVCEKISQRLVIAGHQPVVLSNREVFFRMITSNIKLPDLFVMDFTLFMHHNINIFEYLKEINRVTPLIFYNDPYPKNEPRSIYWEYICKKHFPNMDLEPLSKVLGIIETSIESPELKPYIPLIQKPKPINPLNDTILDSNNHQTINELKQSSNNINSNRKGISIYEFRYKKKIPGVLFRILEYLYDNIETYIPAEELINKFDLNSNGKQSNLAAYISRLRTYLKPEPDDEFKFDILNYRKTYKLIIM